MGKWETLTEKDPQGNLCSEANVLYLDVVLVKREYEFVKIHQIMYF